MNNDFDPKLFTRGLVGTEQERRAQDEYTAYLAGLVRNVDRRRKVYTGPMADLRPWQRAALLIAYGLLLVATARAIVSIFQ